MIGILLDRISARSLDQQAGDWSGLGISQCIKVLHKTGALTFQLKGMADLRKRLLQLLPLGRRLIKLLPLKSVIRREYGLQHTDGKLVGSTMEIGSGQGEIQHPWICQSLCQRHAMLFTVNKPVLEPGVGE